LNGNSSSGKTQDPHQIIIADDDPSVRLLLKHILEKENYHTLEASNGIEALALCEKHRVDLILLDAVMPELNGFEACCKIKQTQPDLPVIIITSLDDDTSVELAFKSGANDYITKPINWSVLKHRILRAKNSSAQNAMQEANELESKIDKYQYSVSIRPRLDINNDAIKAVITHHHSLGLHKKKLIKTDTIVHLRQAYQLLEASCEAFKSQQQTDRLAINIYSFNGNPVQYVNMLREVLEKFEIPASQLDCIFHESHLRNIERIHLYNAISDLPVNLHIGEFSFSLHSLALIKNNRCDAIELDMPLINKTLGDNYEQINHMLAAYENLKLKRIAAGISLPDELTLARKINCSEVSGPSLGNGKIQAVN